MDIKITMDYATPELEFTYLSTKYPTGYYKHSDGAWWFTLIVEIETIGESSKVKLVWFKRT